VLHHDRVGVQSGEWLAIAVRHHLSSSRSVDSSGPGTSRTYVDSRTSVTPSPP